LKKSASQEICPRGEKVFMLIMSPIRTKNWIKKKVIFTSGIAHWYRVVRFSCSPLSLTLSACLTLSPSLFIYPLSPSLCPSLSLCLSCLFLPSHNSLHFLALLLSTLLALSLSLSLSLSLYFPPSICIPEERVKMWRPIQFGFLFFIPTFTLTCLLQWLVQRCRKKQKVFFLVAAFLVSSLSEI